ncbi:MAG TPA: thioesterase family protein [Pseudomonadales bacterium]
MSNLPEWDLPKPFVIELTVPEAAIDSYGHVNNAVYLGWLERCAWAHSAAVGYPESRCIEMGRGMAVRKLNLEYLAACYRGDRILVANWLVANDGRLRATRRFQVINASRAEVSLRGEVLYVCMNLESGRPVRMPPEFLAAYQVTAVPAS